MNVQAHMSGKVPNQAGAQMPVLPQQNGNPLPPQMQNLGGPTRNMSNMDADNLRTRSFIADRIYEILVQRHQPPVNELQKRKCRDIAKRLEEGLFKVAATKEEYMNLETLESRLHNLIKRSSSVNSQNQQYATQFVNNNPSPIGAMIPTPGMSQSEASNMMVASSMDSSMISSSGVNSVAPNNVNAGNVLPSSGLPGGSFNRSDGPLSNGYQQSPANFSVGPGGNMSSMNVQRVTSQMTPTPGFINNNLNQSYMNLESSSNGVGFSTAESTMVSQPQQQRKMLDHHVVHASRCRSAQCQDPGCRQVKELFRHGRNCETCSSGGCDLCKSMWFVIACHACACEKSECHVPRCKDLKEYMTRQQEQSDSLRRAAVVEMMRQRAAELTINDD